MPALSQFQSLPLHIAEYIAQYLVSADRSPPTPASPAQKAAIEQWMTLHNVCWYWRELALGYFCKDATVGPAAEGASKPVVALINWPSSHGTPGDKHYRYTKHVTFSFDEFPDPLSTVLANAFSVWPDDMFFANVSELTIRVDRNSIPVRYWANSLAEADKETMQRFTKSILEAFPRFRKISVNMRRPNVLGKQSVLREVFEKHGLQRLLMSISAGTTITDTVIGPTALVEDYPYLINESTVTTLHYNYSNYDELALNVIMRNAPVLVSLVLESTPFDCVQIIVQDFNGQNPIVYPRLKKLEFLAKSYWALGNIQKVKTGIPFPSLESAMCEIMYIFDDDTLFRGCGKTLKHLDLHTCYDATKMLLEHGVPEKLQNLRSISLTNGYQPTYLEDGQSYFLRFAFGIVSPETRSLSLLDFRGDHSIVGIVSAYPATQSLSYLNIYHIKLQLTNVIELIQMLPNLKFLCYSCGGLGSSLGRVLYKEMPGMLHKTYFPLSSSLKRCDINTVKRTPTRSIALTAMLLAILCPRFVFAKVPSDLADAYNSIIENAIGDEPYLEHSDRLKRLLN